MELKEAMKAAQTRWGSHGSVMIRWLGTDESPYFHVGYYSTGSFGLKFKSVAAGVSFTEAFNNADKNDSKD